MKKILIGILILVSFSSSAQQWEQYSGRRKEQLYADSLYVVSSHSTSAGLVLLAKDSAGNKAFHVKLPSHLQKIPQSLNVNMTDVANVGSGEDDLMSYTIPAGTLANNGDHIEFTMSFNTAINVNAKTIQVYYGASILTLGSLSASGGFITINGRITRTGATSQRIELWYNSTNDSQRALVATGSQTLSGTVVLKATGEGVSNDDIIQKTLTVKYFPY